VLHGQVARRTDLVRQRSKVVAVRRLEETGVVSRGLLGGETPIQYPTRELVDNPCGALRVEEQGTVAVTSRQRPRASSLGLGHAHNPAIHFGQALHGRSYIEVAELFRLSGFNRCASLVR